MPQLTETRCSSSGRSHARIAFSASTASSYQQFHSRCVHIDHSWRLKVSNYDAHWYAYEEVLSIFPELFLGSTWFTVFSPKLLLVLEVIQCEKGRVGYQVYIAAFAPISAVRSAFFNEFLTTKRGGSIAALSTVNNDFRSVNEYHYFCSLGITLTNFFPPFFLELNYAFSQCEQGEILSLTYVFPWPEVISSLPNDDATGFYFFSAVKLSRPILRVRIFAVS